MPMPPAKPSKRRPTKYTPELAQAIVDWVSTGETLNSFLRQHNEANNDTLGKRAVNDWRLRYPDFDKAMLVARDEGYEALAEGLLEIADDARNDWMESLGEDGKSVGYVLNGEHIQRSKLRSDNRKWLLAHWHPTRYGDRQQIDVTGEIGLRALTDEQLDARAKALLEAKEPPELKLVGSSSGEK